MRNILVIIAVAVLYLTSTNADAACDGNLRKQHKQGDYIFSTTSRVYSERQHLVYEACVENQASKTLEFRWYIPELHSWVPANTSVRSPRYENPPINSPDNSYPIGDGCLRYGTLHIPHFAQFHTRDSDESRLACEREVRCRQVVYAGRCHEDPIESTWDDPLGTLRTIFTLETWRQVFAPSSSSDPERTMVQLDAHVQIEPMEAGTMFRHSLAVHATTLGPDSRPDLLRLHPQSSVLREAYASIGLSGDELSVFGNEPFITIFRTPDFPRLRETRFYVVNDDSEHVATLLVPLWDSK